VRKSVGCPRSAGKPRRCAVFDLRITRSVQIQRGMFMLSPAAWNYATATVHGERCGARTIRGTQPGRQTGNANLRCAGNGWWRCGWGVRCSSSAVQLQ